MSQLSRKSRRRRRTLCSVHAIDRLEPRTLFTGYIPSTIASLSTSLGSTPDGGLVVDSNGNLFGTASAGGSAAEGSVFEIAAGTTTVTTVASFTGTNGNAPMGTLYRDSAGTLWGTTSAGGTNNAGSIFKVLNGSNTIVPVASFTFSAPYHPTGNLVADSAGDLFGTAILGGSGQGGIFELVSGATTITTLATATNGTPQPDLTIDTAGNLYGATATGGPAAYGTVFKLAKGATKITTLVALTSGSLSQYPGYMPSGGLVVDSTGNLFGELYAQTTTTGSGSLFEIPSGSSSLNELVYFSSSTGVNPTGGLVADATGDLFGTTSNTVFEYSHSKLTYTTQNFYGSTHGRLLIDSAGNLIGDTSNGGNTNVGLIYKFTPAISCSFTQSPTTATAGTPFSPVVKVALLDSGGNVMNTSSAMVTLTAASLTGTTSVAAVKGIATFTGVALTKTGSTTLTASSSGTIQGISSSITVSPAAPAKLQFKASVPNAVAGQRIGGLNSLIVQLADAYGNVATGPRYDSITLTIVSTTGSAALTGTTTIAMNGTSVTFTGVSSATAGTGYALSATDTTYPTITTGTSSTFNILPQAFQFSTVFNFDGTTSGNPNGPLLFDSTGNLYGTTGIGGSNNSGTAYEIPANGPVTPTYYNGVGTAANGSGTGPIGGLVADQAGNLYGTDNSSIFKIPVGSTTPVTIGTFYAFNQAYFPDAEIAVDPAGDVFGASYNGGDYKYGNIFEIPSGGTLTTLHSFNSSDGYEPEGGLVIDSNGNLFGTTEGSSFGGTIFEIPVGTTTPIPLTYQTSGYFLGNVTVDAAGNLYGAIGNNGTASQLFELVKGASTLTILTTFDGNDGTIASSPPIVDSAGNLFGTTVSGGTSGFGTFYELPHGQSTPIAYYNFNYTSQTDVSYLLAMSSLSFDNHGNLWGVANANGSSGRGALFEISPNPTLTLTGTNYLRMDSDHIRIDVYNNSTGTGTPVQQVPLVNLSAINVSSGASTLTIDCSAGIPLPPGGLSDTAATNLTLIGTTGSDSVSTVPGLLTFDALPIVESAPVTFAPNGGYDSLNISTASFTLDKPFLATTPNEKFSSLVVGATGNVDASVLLTNGKADVLNIGTLSINGRFNLGSNDMDITQTSLSAVNLLLQSAFDNGDWLGNGIFSSTAATNPLTTLASIQNNENGAPLFSSTNLFHGSIPGQSDVLIAYTYFGDANLDGKVDGSDYTRIDNTYSGSQATGWFNGDFNYDNVVNGSDYTLIDNAFNTQGARLNAQIANPTSASRADSKPNFVAETQADAPNAALPDAFTLERVRRRANKNSLLSFFNDL